MKFKYLTNTFGLIAMAASVAMTSCSSNEKDIAGSWIGGEERLFLNQESLANCQATSRFTFTPDQGSNDEGKIDIFTDVVIQDAVPSNDSIVSTYEITVTGTAKISGTYVFEDDDDIIITLDSKTLDIAVDPEGVAFASNVITDQETPAVEPLSRKDLATKYSRQLRGAVTELYGRYVKIDDVKIHDATMSCEIQDKPCSLRRIDNSSK